MGIEREFHAGDRVVVRDWDDMAAEYGLRDGGILVGGPVTGVYFNHEMRKYCGQEFIVRSVNQRPSGRVVVKLKSGPEWTFIPEMFNHFFEDDVPDGEQPEEGDFFSVLLQG